MWCVGVVFMWVCLLVLCDLWVLVLFVGVVYGVTWGRGCGL